MTPERLYRRLAALWPRRAEGTEQLRRSLVVLDWEITASTVGRAGYGAGVFVGAVTMLLAVAVPARFRLPALLGAVALGLFVAHAVQTVPQLLATARRTRALGAAPDLVSRLVLRMRLEPTPEAAAAFAADSGDRMLTDSLARHVRAVRGSPQSGLASFGDTWADSFPALRRSVSLLLAAGTAPDADRERLLDRALTVVFDGTRDQMQAFASRIRAPVTALYAFGVLLPTALVALLPAASAAGLPVTLLSVVVIYDLLVPAVIATAAVRLLTDRPVAFPPPNLTTAHPSVPDKMRGIPRWFVVFVAATSTAGGGWLLAPLLFPSWAQPISALGFGVGTWLWLWYRPVIDSYERLREAEEALPDALELVGRRVANGRAVETAVPQAAAELDGPLGQILADGATRQRQLQVSIHDAFLADERTLAALPSQRLRESVSLLSLAAAEGRPAGEALLVLADHTDDLQRIEREARHNLAQVCRTLRSTGAVFAPLVAGATVALADGIGGEGHLPGGEQSLPWLGSTVGVYVLVLAVVLVTLATGLTRGLDRSLVGYRVGQALVAATGAFLCSYLAVGTIV